MPPWALDRHPQPLFTERLILQPLGPEHAPALFAALRDPAVYDFIPERPPTAVVDLEARYRRTSAGPPDDAERWWNWAVAGRDQPETPFGTVETSISRNARRAVMGYVFGSAAWGRSWAFEACSAVLVYLHAHVPGTPVEAFIDTRNVRSVALAERLGFERVETLVGADYIKGVVSDEYRYRLAAAGSAGVRSAKARSASRSSR
ncbi:MAG: GNAT family N-acetyltransferase [Candidatus Eremiobacteraeota bacterium]|nr:GNAT family N-acetyltransferase [Candidatus Eremiobacteraeota bacterium]MBC5804390.1 GNAT family N-acetyltransferase [Candidatus Eremiobacteraeota bacterium]MBC5821143.1 GNAT family N-acetyltransferase [Candidatus Eremiobacteraeota bacterium]